MRYIFFASVFLVACQATFAQPCHSLEKNSCWHAKNETNEPVQFSCSYRNRTVREIFNTGNLRAQQLYSKQFDRGWADGLGYAVSPLDCQAKYGRQIITLRIPEMPFGAHITFTLKQLRIHATVYDSWNRGQFKEYYSN